jgi:hypothetical protein
MTTPNIAQPNNSGISRLCIFSFTQKKSTKKNKATVTDTRIKINACGCKKSGIKDLETTKFTP